MNRVIVELGSVSEETKGYPEGEDFDSLTVQGKQLSFVEVQID